MHVQEMDTAQELVHSDAMREEGIIYLDCQSVEVSLSEGMRWRVYGSPVRT